MEKFCSKCGRQCAENDSFCPDCGTSLVMQSKQDTPPEELKIFCTKCGKQCNANNKFCPNCGNPISLDVKSNLLGKFPMFSTLKRIKPNASAKNSSTLRIIITVIIVLFIIVGIVGNIGFGKRYTCSRCETSTHKIYYDLDGQPELCEDCAKDYWAPFDYEKYRVK